MKTQEQRKPRVRDWEDTAYYANGQNIARLYYHLKNSVRFVISIGYEIL